MNPCIDVEYPLQAITFENGMTSFHFFHPSYYLFFHIFADSNFIGSRSTKTFEKTWCPKLMDVRQTLWNFCS